MSVKHVQEYYVKVTNDYHMMTKALEEMEKAISDSGVEAAQQNLPMIKQQVAQLKENYMRISYIMFLLNMPNRKEKQSRYVKREKKKLDAIPKEHRLLGVLREDREILNSITSLTKD